MNRDDVNWAGNFCAVVTPFTEDGSLDLRSFTANIELLLSEGIDGIVVAGHTGESWALRDDERFELFKHAVAVCSGKVPVIGGISAIRPDDTLALVRMAEQAKIDGMLLTAPAYAMVNEREIYEYFYQISTSAVLPIMLYNIPRRIGRSLSPNLIYKLSKLPTIVALKQSSPSFDEMGEVLAACGHLIRVFAGSSALRGLPAASIGVDGFVSSTETQVLGREAISLFKLAREGRLAEARDIQRRCARLFSGLHQLGTEPAGLKAAMNYLGRPGGFPRPPVLPLQASDQEELRKLVDEVVSIDSPARLAGCAR